MYRSGRTEVVHPMYRNGHVPNWSYPKPSTPMMSVGLCVGVSLCSGSRWLLVHCVKAHYISQSSTATTNTK